MAAKQESRKKVIVEQSKELRLRWQFGAYAMGVVMLLGALGFAYQQLTRDDVLPITELKLVGEFGQVASETLKDIVSKDIDGNFFTVNVTKIHRDVTALPWVSFAWVDRVWPHTLQVRIVEEKPVAYMQDKGLLNAQGEIFATDVDEHLSDVLPQLSGTLDSSETLVKKYKEFSSYFDSYGLAIRVLKLDERGSWRMRLTNDVEIVMGQEQVEQRLIRFLKIFGQKLANEKVKIKRVDLRYANGFTLSELNKQMRTVVS